MKRHFQILERFRRSLLAGQQLHESVPSSHVKNFRDISALSSSEVLEKTAIKKNTVKGLVNVNKKLVT
jgi:hypothetical protein